MKELNTVVLDGTIIEIENSLDKDVKIILNSNGGNLRADAPGELGAWQHGKIGQKVRIVGHLNTDEDGMFILIEHIEFKPNSASSRYMD